MANLDTQDKRASALGIDLLWLHVYPNPDGTVSQLDRQQVAAKYSGITSSTSAPPVLTATDFIIYARRHNMR